jgi:hypothetical protein
LTKDFAELSGLLMEVGQSLGRKQLAFDEEAQPAASLSEFLQTDSHFVNEIAATLRGTCLFVIRSAGSAAAHYLSPNVPTKASIWQRVSDLAPAHCKVDQSLR